MRNLDRSLRRRSVSKFEVRFMFLMIVFQLSVIIGLLWRLLHQVPR